MHPPDRDEAAIYMPKMTGALYEKKVKEFLENHLDHIVIHRLRTNQPLTKTDLDGLEKILAEIGNEDGQTLLQGRLARSEAPSLAHFVRSMVGMDRAVAQAAFSVLLSDQSLTPPQIRFIEMIIEQLTARGVIEAGALYEPPLQQPARRRSGRALRRQEDRHHRDLQRAQIYGASDPRRHGLTSPLEAGGW